MWLRDCVSNDPLQAELLLVYSEAADEAAKIDRDRFTQAILQFDQSFVLSEELDVVLGNNQCQIPGDPLL